MRPRYVRGHLKMTRKEPKNHMKKVLKHILSVLKYTLLAGFLFPIINLNNLVETWLNPYYWLECLIAITVVYAIMVYCTKINPRTFYPAVGKPCRRKSAPCGAGRLLSLAGALASRRHRNKGQMLPSWLRLSSQ